MSEKDKREQADESQGLLARIKRMFGGGKVPKETEMLISGVESVQALRVALDNEITENEVYAGQIERELLKLGEQTDEQKASIRGGTLSERAKINALRTVKRLNTRISSYERRLKILQDNIDLHFQVLNQVDEMEAMEMKAVKREQIDEIAVDYEERMEKHRDLVNAVRTSLPEVEYEDLMEKQELAKLEAEILAEAGDDLSEDDVEAELAAAEAAAKLERETETAPAPAREEEAQRRPNLDDVLAQEREQVRRVEPAERSLEME